MDISDHDHPMHKGPHESKYMHPSNRLQVKCCGKGSHAEGDSNHIKSVMGEPKGADVKGHMGKMKM